jgi:hypothetical protein
MELFPVHFSYINDSCKNFCMNYRKTVPENWYGWKISENTDMSKYDSENSFQIENKKPNPNYENKSISKTDSLKFCCDVCTKYKRYTFYSCKLYIDRIKSRFTKDLIRKKQQLCITCQHLQKKDCPLLELDINLFKRILFHLNIKLKIPENNEIFNPLLPKSHPEPDEYDN